MKKLFTITLAKYSRQISFILLAIVSATFFYHGVKAFTLPESFMQTVMVLNFDQEVAKIFLYIVGVFDIAVATALLLWRHWLVKLYASLWPFVPAFLGMQRNPEEWLHFLTDALMPVVLIVIAQILISYSKRSSSGNKA